MPSSISGAFALFLFVLLLLPGFTYIRVRERDTPERRRSPFQETVGFATVSIIADAAALVVVVIVGAVRPSLAPDVGRLIGDGSKYVADSYALLAVWLVIVVALATGGAWLVAFLRRSAKTHPSRGSSWWLLFGDWYPTEAADRRLKVGCVLDDGSYVEGMLGSWNDLADDSPDRDLILVEPLIHRLKDEPTSKPYDASIATVSAGRIVSMFVTPLETAPPVPTPDPEVAAKQSSAAEARPPAVDPGEAPPSSPTTSHRTVEASLSRAAAPSLTAEELPCPTAGGVPSPTLGEVDCPLPSSPRPSPPTSS